MTTIRWTALALADLRDIEAYIARQSPRYAQAMVSRIFDRIEVLSQSPESGAPLQGYGEEMLRELIERPYRIVYRVSEQEIDIIAIVHAARNWPNSP